MSRGSQDPWHGDEKQDVEANRKAAAAEREAEKYKQEMKEREARQSMHAARALHKVTQGGHECIEELSAEECSSLAIQYLDLDPDGLTVGQLRDGIRQYFLRSDMQADKRHQAQRALGQCMQATRCLKGVAANLGRAEDLDMNFLRFQIEDAAEAIDEELEKIRAFLG